MKPSFVLFLNHGLCLILSREEKRGRYGLMTHMARKSGLGVLHFGAFVKLGGKWQLIILGFIRVHCEKFPWPSFVDTAYTLKAHTPAILSCVDSQGWIYVWGPDICCLSGSWCCLLVDVDTGSTGDGVFWRELGVSPVLNGQEWPPQSWPLALWGVRG